MICQTSGKVDAISALTPLEASTCNRIPSVVLCAGELALVFVLFDDHGASISSTDPFIVGAPDSTMTLNLVEIKPLNAQHKDTSQLPMSYVMMHTRIGMLQSPVSKPQNHRASCIGLWLSPNPASISPIPLTDLSSIYISCTALLALRTSHLASGSLFD